MVQRPDSARPAETVETFTDAVSGATVVEVSTGSSATAAGCRSERPGTTQLLTRYCSSNHFGKNSGAVFEKAFVFAS